jgi:hypothetical protein
MTDIEAKALALVNEVNTERSMSLYSSINRKFKDHEALCRAIEQHEAFKQEVSDAVKEALKYINRNRTHEAASAICNFVIRDPDPLVKALEGVKFDHYPPNDAKTIRAALEARGLEIREKGQ